MRFRWGFCPGSCLGTLSSPSDPLNGFEKAALRQKGHRKVNSKWKGQEELAPIEKVTSRYLWQMACWAM